MSSSLPLSTLPPPPSFPPRMVAIKPIGGLASRLKCIASFGVIAAHFRVPLHVCWNESVGFEQIELERLFDALPTDTKLLPVCDWTRLRGSEAHVIPLERYISYLNSDYRYSFYKLEELFRTRKPYRITAECCRDLQKLFGGVLNRFIPGFHQAYVDRLHAFRPCAEVRERVGAEVREWARVAGSTGSTETGSTEATPTGTKPVVFGVHLRRNDALHSPLAHRYTTPSESECELAIDRHLAHSKAHLVFLATDDPGVYDRFQTRYATQPQFRCFPWKRYPQNVHAFKHGQRKAAVDLWTLRCCDRVMGTHFSVFSEVGQLRLREEGRVEVREEWCGSDAITTDTTTDAATDATTDTPDSPPPSTPLSTLPTLLRAIHLFDDEPEPKHLIEERAQHQAQKVAAKAAAQEAQKALQSLVTHANQHIAAAATAVRDARVRTTRAHDDVRPVMQAVRDTVDRIIHKADRAEMACRGEQVNAVLLRKRVLGPRKATGWTWGIGAPAPPSPVPPSPAPPPAPPPSN